MNKVRSELKIGFIFLALFGFFNAIVPSHEFIKGLLFALAIAFIIVGTLPDKGYSRLKQIKNRRQ